MSRPRPAAPNTETKHEKKKEMCVRAHTRTSSWTLNGAREEEEEQRRKKQKKKKKKKKKKGIRS